MAAQDEIPGLGPRTDRPRLNTAADLTQLKLSPTEGFVLSRVDGQLSYDDICKVSGLGREQTLEILCGLKQSKLILGPSERVVGGGRKSLRPATPKPVVEAERKTAATDPATKPGEPAPPSPEPLEARSQVVSQKAQPRSKSPTAPATGRSPGPLERLDDGTPVQASEIKDWPDAEPLLKERIIRLHRRMKHLTALELLGIPPDAGADAGAIRRAFAIASKELHPDRYFGKDLGGFKAKLAAIFARLTEAMQEIEGGNKGKR